MAAPVGRKIGKGLESVRDSVVDLLLLRVRLSIRLADTLGDNARVALCVAGVLAILALHTCRVFEKVTAERAAHDVVELALHKLVSVDIVDFLLALTNGTLSTETGT